MKKFSIRLWIIYFLVICATSIAFAFAYIKLNDNYLEKQVANSLVYMTEKVAVDINVKTTSDYEVFDDLMEDINSNINDLTYRDRTAAIRLATRSSELSGIKNLTNMIYGYVNDEQGYFLVNSNNDSTTWYQFTDQYRHNQYYKQKIAIYRLSTTANYEDSRLYVFFRNDNVFLAFDADNYFKSMLNDIENMPDNYYMLIDKSGGIAYQKDINSSKNKLYADYLKSGNTSTAYEYLSIDLANMKTGYQMYRIFGKTSFFTYTPILSELATEGLFVVYVYARDNTIASDTYLNKVLITTFVSVFVIIAIGLAICLVISMKKAEGIEISKIAYFFTKCYAMQINKKGKIRFFNKTCKNQFKEIRKYKSIYDFEAYNQENDVMNDIILQQGVTLVASTIRNVDIYIHFIPVKSFANYYLLGEDITEVVKENAKNRKIALFNPVTNLPNRNLLDRALEEILNSKNAFPKKKALICLNVLDFAKINRIFGFYFADKMLRGVADIIKTSLKDIDATIYNIRTSVFMVLFNDVGTYTDVFDWATNVIDTLSQPIDITDDYLTTIEVKVGIFNIEPEKYSSLTAKNIYEYANTALERAQNSRQLKCAVYNNEFSQAMTREQVIEQDLREAISKHEFVMFFQPQYDIQLNKITGFEALLRCKNPKLKLESPEHYISIAEKNGMIVEIGKVIISETFAFAKRLEEYNVRISMNVSPVQLLQSGFANELIKDFKEYNLKPGSIAIEITETFLMENSHIMIDKLRLLKEHGFDVHLDDFGIGYSSMLYLKDLPIDAIKIDKEFIKHVMNDNFSRVIVSKIIQIALSLDLGIIAEGVETEKQSAFLLKTGCKTIQGYLMSPAVSDETAIDYVIKYNVNGELLIKEPLKRKSNKKDNFILNDVEDYEPDIISTPKKKNSKKDPEKKVVKTTKQKKEIKENDEKGDLK